MVFGKQLKKSLGKKNFNFLVYTIGAILEVFGFLLLFSLMEINRVFLSIILIIGGYLLAVSVRK